MTNISSHREDLAEYCDKILCHKITGDSYFIMNKTQLIWCPEPTHAWRSYFGARSIFSYQTPSKTVDEITKAANKNMSYFDTYYVLDI